MFLLPQLLQYLALGGPTWGHPEGASSLHGAHMKPIDSSEMHPTGECVCGGQGVCTWCLMDSWREDDSVFDNRERVWATADGFVFHRFQVFWTQERECILLSELADCGWKSAAEPRRPDIVMRWRLCRSCIEAQRLPEDSS